MNAAAYRILYVDDQPLDAERVERMLQTSASRAFTVNHVTTAEACIEALSDHPYDMILLDLELADVSGLKLLERIRAAGDEHPVLVIAANGDEYVAVNLIEAGADGYLRKNDLTPPNLLDAISEAQQRANKRKALNIEARKQQKVLSRLEELNQELAEASQIDPLTRLYNRRAWTEAIRLQQRLCGRYEHAYAVLMIDVDHFKLFNDSRGHLAGDQCLAKVAERIQASCRNVDVVGRYGGEEFVVLCPDTVLAGARKLAERICTAVWSENIPHPGSPSSERITVSIGIATSNRGDGWEDVIRTADNGLYLAKKTGRNRVRATQTGTDETHESRAILAIEDDPGDAEILRRLLGQLPDVADAFLHCTRIDEAVAQLGKQPLAAVFIDFLLGAENGLKAVKALRAAAYLGPIVVLTGQGDEYSAARLIRSGADDYLVKSDLTPEALRRCLANARAQHRRREYEAQNATLLGELSVLTEALEGKNRRLAQLYETAHTFVDNVSHEFRTPLTVIKEFTSIIADGLAGAVTTEQQQYLSIILNRVDDLTTMVNDMLDISKLEAGCFGIVRQSTSVSRILERVLPTLERKAALEGTQLRIEPPDALPDLFCDEEKVARIIINLVVNALKFSPEGGAVTLQARAEVESGVVRFSVTDEGPGIAKEHLDAIFKRFRQVGGDPRASTKGFGLGLNIVKELAHFNFGEVHVTSTLGEGSVFSFTLPVNDPAIIIERYANFRSEISDGTTSAALLALDIDDNGAERSGDLIDQFLHDQLRRFDLLLRVTSKRWLLVSDANRATATDVVERFTRCFQEWCRARDDVAPPALRAELIEVLELPLNTAALQARVRDRMQGFVTCLA